uniref:CSON004983 protein n=1 Tax=Culicoides sonorensis TaxID=179676 RepID=A0A336LY73_CULSO
MSLCESEIERSKVRVTFFENSKPQVISSPEFNSLILYGDTVFGDTFSQSQEVYLNGDLVQLSGAGDLFGSDENSNNKMATLTELPPNYDRQQSGKVTPSQSHGGALYYLVQVPREEYEKSLRLAESNNNNSREYYHQQVIHYSQSANAIPTKPSTDSGWDNPFRPDGDLSKEADEIVNLIKGGKPITPTSETHLNGNALKDSVITENGTTIVDGAVKSEKAQLNQSAKSPQKGSTTTTNNAATTGNTKNGDTQQISNQVIPGPQSATNVVIDDKKKKKRCCVIQ